MSRLVKKVGKEGVVRELLSPILKLLFLRVGIVIMLGYLVWRKRGIFRAFFMMRKRQSFVAEEVGTRGLCIIDIPGSMKEFYPCSHGASRRLGSFLCPWVMSGYGDKIRWMAGNAICTYVVYMGAACTCVLYRKRCQAYKHIHDVRLVGEFESICMLRVFGSGMLKVVLNH